MMFKQHRYYTMSKQCFVLFICLFAGIPTVSAQSHFITKQPQDATICEFQSTPQLSVELNGSYSCQWFTQQAGTTNWVSIPGAIFTIYNPITAGKYYCVVTKSSTESEQSNTVTFTIHKTPYISTPGFEIPPVCDESELRVELDPANISAQGSPITSYEWKLVDKQGSQPTITQPGTGGTIADFIIPTAFAEQSGMVLTLTLTNGCGSTLSSEAPIFVREIPPLPQPVVGNYCQGTTAVPLSITSDNPAIWFDAGGNKLQSPPTPSTSSSGTQTWWVSQIDPFNCESDRAKAIVEIFPIPAPPATNANIELCLNEPGLTLNATGTDLIQWYDEMQKLPSAPQINTSEAVTKTYYVTQNDGNCESPKESGKITVRIKDISTVDAIELSYNLDLCPNNSTVLAVTSKRPNPTFRWYKDEDKIVEILPSGPTLTTPVLMRDTVYYVTVQYEAAGECESMYPKAAVINVRDVTLPKISVQQHIIVNTDDGVCYATNVDTGKPLVSDNCTFEENLLVYANPVVPTQYLMGDTTLVWWVQDEAGNKDYALQTVTVRDREKPKGTCPEDITWYINENENTALVHYSLSYTDNCGEVTDTIVKGFDSGSVFPLGETLVRHLASDKAGNTDTCEFKVIVKYPSRDMAVALRVSAYEICAGQEVVITPVVSGGSGRYNYSWKKPRAWSDAVMRDYPLTNTTYELTVNDGVSPPQTQSVQITVLQTRPVNLTLEGVTMDKIFEDDEVLVTATTGFPSYKLLLNNQEIQTSGLNNKVGFQAELGTYIVRVFATDENGCVSQDQMDIEVDSRRLPNVFTPNHDGINDRFLEGFDLKVFSRSGELLYQGTDGWDGTYKGKLMPQGTYLYVVTRIMNNGEPRVFKDTVTLKL